MKCFPFYMIHLENKCVIKAISLFFLGMVDTKVVHCLVCVYIVHTLILPKHGCVHLLKTAYGIRISKNQWNNYKPTSVLLRAYYQHLNSFVMCQNPFLLFATSTDTIFHKPTDNKINIHDTDKIVKFTQFSSTLWPCLSSFITVNVSLADQPLHHTLSISSGHALCRR